MRKLVAALAVPVVFGLAACGGSSSSSTGSERPPTPAPSASTAPVAGAGDRKDLPANFPLPPGAKITASVKMPNGISVVLLLTDGNNAVTFWAKELPAAGYTIVQTFPRTDHTLIHFSGNGYSHCSIAVGGDAAHVAMAQ